MKIGVISDIHSNIYGLRSALKEINKLSADLILCAGDITGYYTFVNEVFEVLTEYNIKFIKGDHDNYLFREDLSNFKPLLKNSIEYTRTKINREFMNELKLAKDSYITEIDDVKIAMYHGSPWNHLEEYIYPNYEDFQKFETLDSQVIILGHTHYPMIKKVGKVMILNPGSCGQPRDGDRRASLALLETQTGTVELRRVEYDVEAVCKAIVKSGLDQALIKILQNKGETSD